MDISPDALIVWEWGFIKLNYTILFTWLVMTLLVLISWLITRRLSTSTDISSGQNLLEVIVSTVQSQIEEVSGQNAARYMPFIGSLFIFIAVSNLLAIVPGYHPPTGSLSVTAALAICVFIAVPIYGITQQGLGNYFRQYFQPTWIMLPFNIIGEVTRTLSLAVRLFGNVMSGTMIAAILLTILPLFFPIILQVLGLITGLIQAYIFAILAMVYIASATRSHQGRGAESSTKETN
jgi:F-type H+-transporting ATPase subunit a